MYGMIEFASEKFEQSFIHLSFRVDNLIQHTRRNHFFKTFMLCIEDDKLFSGNVYKIINIAINVIYMTVIKKDKPLRIL
jgi:hypothetical protein